MVPLKGVSDQELMRLRIPSFSFRNNVKISELNTFQARKRLIKGLKGMYAPFT